MADMFTEKAEEALKINEERLPEIKVGNVIGRVVLAATAFFLATNIAYQTYKSVNELFRSEAEKIIEDKYHMNIMYTGPMDIRNKYLFNIADVLNKESRISSLNVREIDVLSNNILLMPFYQQMHKILLGGCSGQYNTIFDKIDLFTGYMDIITHEITHAKEDSLSDKHPEFAAQWLELSNDSSGNSLYNTFWSYLSRRLMIINKFNVDTSDYDEMTKKNLDLGFISNYARTNMSEDIAELCEEILHNPIRVYNSRSNEVLMKKVKLAENYGIIPKEFTEYMKIVYEDFDSKQRYKYVMMSSERKAHDFAIYSINNLEEFITKHPQSIYVPEARVNKVVWYEYMNYHAGENTLEQIKEECLKILKSDYKPSEYYYNALCGMMYYHADDKSKYFEAPIIDFQDIQYVGNMTQKERMFLDAAIQYYSGYDEREDIRIIYNGVNDILEKLGLLK